MAIKVTLQNTKPLSGTGTCNEDLLATNGWNDLPAKKKYGFVEDMWQEKGSKALLFTVRFPHCNNILLSFFRDELKEVQELRTKPNK